MPDIGHYVEEIAVALVMLGYRRSVQVIDHVPAAGALISPPMKIHGCVSVTPEPVLLMPELRNGPMGMLMMVPDGSVPNPEALNPVPRAGMVTPW